MTAARRARGTRRAGGTLRLLAGSRWVKLALVAVTLGFCAYGLFPDRDRVIAALGHLAWYSVAGALLAAIAGLGCMMLSWRALLADLGSPLPVRAAGSILFVAQLAKFVPGAVWAPAAQVELARSHQVPRSRSASAAVVNMLVTLATALLVASVALPLSSSGAARSYWWALALAPVAVGALYPPVTGFLLDRALRLARRPPLERRIGTAGMLKAAGWALAGWLCYSMHAWLLVTDLTGRGVAVLPLAVGAYTLAWAVGFILIPFPGGVGPRELALVVALAPVMPVGTASAVALVSRLVTIIADLTWASLGFALGRGARREGGGQPGRPGGGQGPPGQEQALPGPEQGTQRSVHGATA